LQESTTRALQGIVAALAIGLVATLIAWYAETYHNYAAIVDGTYVSRADYEALSERMKKDYAARFGVDFDSENGKRIAADIKETLVKQLIDRELVRQEATRRKIVVGDAMVGDRITTIKRDFKEKGAFEQALQNNQMTLDAFKERIRETLLVEEVSKAVNKESQISETAIQRYYEKNKELFRRPEEVNARHILVKDEKSAQDILRKLKANEPFTGLAMMYSLDPGSKSRGGELGYFTRGQMVPAFEKVAFALKYREVSKPVKTQFGYHIIQGGELRPARILPLNNVRDDIKARILRENSQQAYQRWLTERRAKADISYGQAFKPAVLESSSPTPSTSIASPKGQSAPATPAPAKPGTGPQP
jgi:foldase protein PrsA